MIFRWKSAKNVLRSLGWYGYHIERRKNQSYVTLYCDIASPLDSKFTWQFIECFVMATSIQHLHCSVKLTTLSWSRYYDVAAMLCQICKEHQMITIHDYMVASSQLCHKFVKKLIMTWRLSGMQGRYWDITYMLIMISWSLSAWVFSKGTSHFRFSEWFQDNCFSKKVVERFLAKKVS